jgi:hypothetical protein
MVMARPFGVVLNGKDVAQERRREIAFDEHCARAEAAYKQALFWEKATRDIERRFRRICNVQVKKLGVKLESIRGTAAVFKGSKSKAMLTMNKDGLTFRLHLFQSFWFLEKYSPVTYEKLSEAEIKEKLRSDVM